MIKKILAAIDGSPCSTVALRTAAALSAAVGGTLGVLHVMESRKPMLTQDDFTGKWIHCMSEKAAGKFPLQLETGNPAKAICSAAEKGNYDLVVMGSRGLGDISGMILGSVSHGVLEQSSVPVLIVGPRAEEAGESRSGPIFKNIVVPIDGGHSYRALIEAASLAVKFSSSLIILNVIPTMNYAPYFIGPTEIGTAAPFFEEEQKLLAEAGGKLLSEARSAVSAFPVPVKTRLETGDAAVVIDSVSREENAGLIVMGTSRPSELAGLVFAGAGHRVLENAPCPVLFIGSQKRQEVAAAV